MYEPVATDVQFDHSRNSAHSREVQSQEMLIAVEGPELDNMCDATEPVADNKDDINKAAVPGHCNCCEEHFSMVVDKVNKEMQSLSMCNDLFKGMFGQAMLWALPFLLACLAFIIASLAGHLATFYYIRYMKRIETIMNDVTISGTDSFSRAVHAGLTSSAWFTEYHLDYPQKLQDLIASATVTTVNVPIEVLDLSLFPVVMSSLALTLYHKDLYMWTKTMLLTATLFLGKSFCSIATVMPDSAGWEACKERLTAHGTNPDAVGAIENMHINWWSNGIKSFVSTAGLELSGLRYCGDMVYSAQTFLLLLYAQGLYEQITRQNKSPSVKIRIVLAVTLVLYIGAVTMLALLARLHYTLDVFLAVLLTVLWYDSATVSRLCTSWASLKAELKVKTASYVKEEEVNPALSIYEMLFTIATLVWDVYNQFKLMSQYYFQGDRFFWYYFSCSFLVGICLTALAWKESSIKQLRIWWRGPLCLLFGFSQLLGVIQQVTLYHKNTEASEEEKRDDKKAKLLRTGFASAPLALLQLTKLANMPYDMHIFAMLKSGDNIGFSHWLAWLSICSSAVSLGLAYAAVDLTSSSVFGASLRTASWKIVFMLFRGSDALINMSIFVGLQHFGGNLYLAFAKPGVEFILCSILAYSIGAYTEPIACMGFGLFSLPVNYYLNQQTPERREVADILLLVRGGQVLAVLVSIAYSMKMRRPFFDQLFEQPELLAIFVMALVLHGPLLFVVLRLRKIHSVDRAHDNASDSETE